MLRRTEAGRRRSGFTLVEILVVLLIIALLIGLLIPAVMKFQDSGKKAETNWQIAQIGQAADMFGASEQMGRVGYLPAPPFRLRGNYTTGSPTPAYDPEVNYLRNVFTNLNPAATGFPDADLNDANQIAVFFLTGGPGMQYQGFATNSQQPYTAPISTGEKRKGPFLQLKETMYDTNPGGGLTANGQAWLIDSYRVPFAMFTAGKGRNYQNRDNNAIQTFVYGGVTISPVYQGTTPQKFESPRSVQVISAGRDKTFGGGGAWGGLVDKKDSMDDLSNFSTEPLGYGPK